MENEVALLENFWWKAHYNQSHYEGGWTILPLRSINGRVDNIISLHLAAAENIPAYKDTVLLEKCAYISTVLEMFKCEKTSVRLMKLHAGAIIKEHMDHDMSFEEGEVRLHIPVSTNAAVAFFLENEQVPMRVGECWYLNLSLKHRVNNFGSTDRVHLVIDCKVNEWIKDQFESNSVLKCETDTEHVPRFSNEENQEIIAQLRLLNTATSLELANKMEKESQ